MDQGAHFYRVDLQAHTPRDPHWKGDRPNSDAERMLWARSLVAACREKGLQAIVITDHHDMAFVDLIREAAAREFDSGAALLTRIRE